ncbi:MAG: zonular occludens toxin domain-containing protein [Gallionellaceae bacterium]|jgi:zona occludens toxin
MLTLITGGTGTGKTAYLVKELQKEIETGRILFTNITGLKLPHYRLGNMSQWQAGTWLHIDRYKRTSHAIVSSTTKQTNSLVDSQQEMEEDIDQSENWEPNSDIVLDEETGQLFKIARDSSGFEIARVPYESHKGALIVIDEAQNHFRPRPQGSAIPDCVTAFEVHRKQGLDFWLCTQRPNQLDSNVRGHCLRHIALRQTWQGRHQYEWPDVNDIDSKANRDQATKTRYTLPKEVFTLYKSADVHTNVSHSMPMMAKMVFIIIPVLLILLYIAYSSINKKINKPIEQPVNVSQQTRPGVIPPGQTQNENFPIAVSSPTEVLLESVPAVPNHPETAPMFSGLLVVKKLPLPSACLRMQNSCKCYTKNGEFLPDIGIERCIELVNTKVFNPYESDDSQQIQYSERSQVALANGHEGARAAQPTATE